MHVCRLCVTVMRLAYTVLSGHSNYACVAKLVNEICMRLAYKVVIG